MKNGIGPAAVERIARALSQTQTLKHSFDGIAFRQQATERLAELELKQRVQHIIETLHDFLPSEFNRAVDCLLQLPPLWDKGEEGDPLRSFAAWPIVDYIGCYGLSHPDRSLSALEKLTTLFSAEFAIRPFLLNHPELCQEYFQQWISHENEQVRRLVSEGTRPRLPWGIQLKPYVVDPSNNLPWLEALKDDDSLYVRRSVANHLNDISKDHPLLVIELCRSWYPTANDRVKWVIKHGLRTLIKSGHSEVFPLLGYSENLKLTRPQLRLKTPTLVLGDTLAFQLTLESSAQSTQSMVVDFALHFVKANGKTAAKVFKWKSVTLDPKQKMTLEKQHTVKAISTRRYYSGEHMLEIIINGTSAAQEKFTLSVEG